MKTVILYASIVGILTAATNAQSADVTWGAPTTVAAVSDISLSGALVGTWAPGDDWGGTTRSDYYTVSPDGLTSMAFAAYGSGFFSTGFSASGFNDRYNGFGGGYDTGTANYNLLLGTAEYCYGSGSFSFTMTGLTVGDTYQLQLWADDGRGNDRIQTFTGGANTSATMLVGPSSGGPGQYVIGTFVADGSGTETISSASPTGAFMNLAQIRDITPTPEPSTLAVIAGGFGMMLLGLRRKNRTA